MAWGQNDLYSLVTVWLKKTVVRLRSVTCSFVGYEPKHTLSNMIRRRSTSSGRRSRSADDQLAELLRNQGARTRQPEEPRGDLLRGLGPAPASGRILDREGPGVRSVRIRDQNREERRTVVREGPGRDGGFLSQVGRESRPSGAGTGMEQRALGESGSTNAAEAAGSGLAADSTAADDRAAVAAAGVGAGSKALSVLSGETGQGRTVGGTEVPMNPFWSPARRAFERLHYEENLVEVGARRSLSGTPQDKVEMDPVALFRLRCLREAEEKFQAGLLQMAAQEPSSTSSFWSVADETKEAPAPPPGPPPPSPPKEISFELGISGPPQPPKYPPLPPMPTFGSSGPGEDQGIKNLLGENPNESLRTFDLPRLDEEATALEFGDWLSMVDNSLGDVSYSSGGWWALVKEAVESSYREWLQVGPVERLRLKPKVDSLAASWPRTERRVLSMLLQAIPEHVKRDLVSSRRLTTDQVLFRLYCIYQPGGALERTRLLQAISDSKCGDTLKDVLSWVRMWRRFVGRALELEITLPDALVLVGVLQQASEYLSQRSPQVAYRLNSMRQQLNLDQTPNTTSAMTYSEHLQAEAEEMMLMGLGNEVRTFGKGNVGKPVVKALEPSGISPPKPPQDMGKGSYSAGSGSSGVSGTTSSGGNGTPGACKFWGLDDGCKRGDRCKFSHYNLSPKDNRCFGCSAIGHNKKDCPHGKKKIAKAKGNTHPKRDGEEDTSESPPKGSSDVGGKGNPERPPGLKGSGEPTGAGGKSPGEPLDHLMQEAAALMKSLRPSVKVINLAKAHSGELVTGLLDGGATNALRKGTEEELAKAMEVSVELAAGSVKLYQCLETGTLLSPEKVEPIVPLRGLVSLGYKIRWDERGCLIYHPQRGRIRCWLRNGCPVVTECHALGLIGDIEAHERFKRMGPKLARGTVTDQEKQWWSERFPEVPARVVDYMVGQNSVPVDGSKLPWNRRTRKRFLKAKALVFHLFAGKEEACKEWEKGWPAGVEVVALDIERCPLFDLHSKEVWGYLCFLARHCPVVGIVGGPPCRTVSRLRNLQPGPPPLRGRSGESRFGLESLGPWEKEKTDGDSALVLKQIALYRISEEHKTHEKRIGFLLESPIDPVSLGDSSDSPTYWDWPEVQELLSEEGMDLVTFDQGSLGHPQVKPTSCVTNLAVVKELHGMSCERNRGERLKENLDERMKQTSSWSNWAPGLKGAIRTSILIILRTYGVDDGSLKKVSGRDQWIQHFKQGHRPFRRDCRSCLLDMGTGKPHRRRDAGGSSSWSLGVDIVQFPHAVDEPTGEKVRYAMVATLLVPVFQEVEETPKTPQEEPCESREEGKGLVEVVDPCWGEGCEEDEFSLCSPEKEEEPEGVDVGHELSSKGDDCEVRENRKEPEDPEFLEGRVDLDEEIGKESSPVKVRHVTVIHPMGSRATSEVIHALNVVATQFKTMGLPIRRLHSDKARELVSKAVQRWASARQVQQTTTGGDDPASAGHVESEVNQLKRRVRFYLRQKGLTSESWPIALRYAAEQRKRQQLMALGTPMLEMLPFQGSVLVKRKRWHERGHLAPPFVEATLLSPSPLMHHGWAVRTEGGQILHVREAVVPSPLGDEVALQLQSEVPESTEVVEISDSKVPPHRLHGKQPMPTARSQPSRVVFGPDPYSPSIAPAEAAGGEMSDLDLGLGEEENGNGNDEKENGNGNEGDENGNGEKRAMGRKKRKTMEKQKCLKTIRDCDPEKSRDCDPEEDETVREWDPEGIREGWTRVVPVGFLEGVWVKQHEVIQGLLGDLVNQIPVGSQDGQWYGEELQTLTQCRHELETSLKELERCKSSSHTARLCGISVGVGPVEETGEVLQTTVIALDEVRRDLDSWKAAMISEYRSLTEETKAIEPVDLGCLNDEEVEYVPGKLVCTLKAGPNGGRKKCRGVICGNLLDQSVDPAPWGSYASGADGLLIRTAVKHGVQQAWGISLTDVKTAFLLAPRPKPEGAREVIVVPPKLLVQAGICSARERWRVHRALYGFPSSPARWSAHRDSVLKTFEWEDESTKFALNHTPEGNLWKVMTVRDGQLDQCVGHVLIYVDDVMVIAPKGVREGFMKRLKQEWAISNPETVNEQDWVRFCGLEFKWLDQQNLQLAQPSYTKDLLDRHPNVSLKSCPMPKWEVPMVPEENVSLEEIRSTQTITGELLWVSVRSRPDVSFAVSLMGRVLSKNPRWAVKVGEHVLGYLASTPQKGLVYGPCQRDRGPNGNLPITRHPELIEAYADISFAPQGGRSCQGLVLFYCGSPIQWEASRQPFCAMSTAESELLGYCEAMQVVQALEALLRVLHGTDSFEKLVCGDNSSAIAILTKPDGPWRTRHLRLRSHGLKEKLADAKGDWKLRHQRGTELIADFLTKPITSSVEWDRFSTEMGMVTDVSRGSEGHFPSLTDSKEHAEVSKVDETMKIKVAKFGVTLAALCSAELVIDESWRGVLRAATALVAIGFLTTLSGMSGLMDPRRVKWLEKLNKENAKRADGRRPLKMLGKMNQHW